MREKLEDYHQLVLNALSLQQELFEAFEAEIEISPDPDLLEIEPFKKLKDILRPGQKVSEILSIWPDDISILPLVVWVKPRVGIFNFKGQIWLFNIHGFLEVQFIGLPSGLEDNVLRRLKAGNIDILHNISKRGPELETSYFSKGRTDGVSDQLMYIYARSTESIFGALSETEHRELLSELVKIDILRHAPNYSYFFVLT
jgi:hypothetical protein